MENLLLVKNSHRLEHSNVSKTIWSAKLTAKRLAGVALKFEESIACRQ